MRGRGERVIFHIDVNSAFLSWEAVDRLKKGEETDLRRVPSAVGGDVESRHGIILAKSIPAKKYGIVTGEPVTDALRKCPGLVLVPPSRGLYREMSKAFIAILEQYSDRIEQVSIDEAFVDMTGTRRLFGEPQEAADRIRRQVFEELGFTVNVGISDNKLLAKMASDFTKPDRTHTLWPEEVPAKMWPLDVGDLLFAGRSTSRRLYGLGIRTIGDLARTDPAVLAKVMGKHGGELWRAANGLGSDQVNPQREDNKGYSHSTTLPFNVTDSKEAKQILLGLTEKASARLRADGRKTDSVGIQIRYSDLSRVSHQMGMAAATDITDEIYGAVCRLFEEKWDKEPIRLLGVRLQVAAEDNGRQLDLFDQTDYEKLEKLDKAMDTIRSRYGSTAVQRASHIVK